MVTDEPRATGAPRPGDPRSVGPRPTARPADLTWLGLAVALVAITAIQFIGLFVALIRVEVTLSAGGMLVGFLITVGWLLTISWFVLGAWRRSVWGCPFDHVVTATPQRACPRHRLVQAPDEAAG